MEDERGFGNIIFYIIAAIIAILTSLKSKKKQQGRPAEPGQGVPSGRFGFPDDLFDDTEEVQGQETVLIPGERLLRQGPTVASANMRNVAGEDVFAKEGMSSLDIVGTAKRFDKLIRSTSTYSYDSDPDGDIAGDVAVEASWFAGDDFDAREAVIFSEIINRYNIDRGLTI